MGIMSIIYFFIVSFGFGYSLTFFLKKSDNLVENLFMTLGFGLGVFPILGVVLNILHIPIYWPVFLFLSLIVPSYLIYKRGITKLSFNKPSLKIKKSNLYISIVLIMSIIFFLIYLKGAFKYPYLEDDDPWLHASGCKYIKETHRISFSTETLKSLYKHYLEPYPPGYDILMGIIYQLNNNVIWTLKFFNVLLISLIGILFYFFALTFLNSRKKALLSMFFLLIIPCFVSHFIWASSLAILLFFPAFYALERIEKNWKWMIPAIVVIASMIMTQMSNPFIFGVMFLVYLIFKSISKKRFLWKIFLAGFLGVIIAFSLFWIPAIMKFGLETTAGRNSVNLYNLESIAAKNAGGGAIYNLNDFIFARTVSKMDNPIGIGVVLFSLLIFSLFIFFFNWLKQPSKIFSKENVWKIITFLWLFISFVGIHGNRLPFPVVMAHRWWATFSIPVVLICTEGFFALGKLSKRIKINSFFIYAIVIIGILITSGCPKYIVETSYWPPGVGWASQDELQGYLSFVKPLPYNTKVFPICSEETKVLAFDKFAEPWNLNYQKFKKNFFNTSAEKLHSWLKQRSYEYIILDATCLKKFSQNETNAKLQELITSPYFQLSYPTQQTQPKGAFIFRVV